MRLGRQRAQNPTPTPDTPIISPLQPCCPCRCRRAQGIKATSKRPNPYLYQSLAVLAAELAVTDEARKWFQLGTETVMVRGRSPSGLGLWLF